MFPYVRLTSLREFAWPCKAGLMQSASRVSDRSLSLIEKAGRFCGGDLRHLNSPGPQRGPAAHHPQPPPPSAIITASPPGQRTTATATMAPVERLSHDELERTSLPPHLHEPHCSTLPSRRARARPRLTPSRRAAQGHHPGPLQHHGASHHLRHYRPAQPRRAF